MENDKEYEDFGEGDRESPRKAPGPSGNSYRRETVNLEVSFVIDSVLRSLS